MSARRDKIIIILAAVFALLFFVCGTLVSLHRYWQFDTFYYDFGIFNQAIWNVSRFQPPIIDHFIVPGKVIFADHFSPSIFIVSPLYWFTDRAEIMLIAQAFFVSMGGFILFLVGEKMVKDKISSFLIMSTYFLFVGIQNAIITDFHELPLLTPFLSLLFLFYVTKKRRLFLLTLIVVLGFKESLFTLGLGLGVFIFLSRKSWRKMALLVIGISIVWGWATIKVIIPFFSQQPYYYSPQLSFKTLFSESDTKAKTLLFSFGTFFFLPIGAPWLWPLYLFHYATRFFSEGGSRWGLGMHYNAEIAPSLAFGSFICLEKIKKIFTLKHARMVSLLAFFTSLMLFRFILHGPFLLAINPVFYQHTKDFAYLEKLIAKIPPNVSISAQNNIAVRFFKQKSFILTDNYQKNSPDYILLDMRPGQNPNNFLGIKDSNVLLKTIQSDKNYASYLHEGDQYIFKKSI